MRNFHVNVNGTNYEVAVEEIDGKTAPVAAAPAAAPVAAPVAAPKAAPAAGANSVTSPMPGNILAVNVKEGEAVKKGQVVMILEAMKMENEIFAPVDGTVTNLSVQKGSTVETGSLLCTIA